MYCSREYSKTSRLIEHYEKSTPNKMFIDEITELQEDMIGTYNNMVILGDLNMHIDDLTNADLYIFNDTMHAFGFKQHVTLPTHKCSHILHLVYSEVNSTLNLHNCKVHEFISDHGLVTTGTTLNKAPWKPTENIIRDTTKHWKSSTLHQSLMAMQALNKHVTNLMKNYTKCLTGLHPTKCMLCRQAKKNHGKTGISVNRRELLIQGSNLQKNKDHHWRAYTTERNKYNGLLQFHKKTNNN